MKNYWLDCISYAAEDCGAVLTQDQIEYMATQAENAHDNYGQASGDDVANRNYRDNERREIESLQAKLYEERQKVVCKTCKGTGEFISYGGTLRTISRCHVCNGDGRVSPKYA